MMAMAALAALTVAQAVPYYAERLSRSMPGEPAGSPALGARLERSVRVFPLLAEPWAKLGTNHRQRSADPLQGLTTMPKVEQAYLRAIDLNPYVAKYYSQLRDVYAEMNETAKGLDTLTRGVRNNPNDLILRLLLVRELERNGRLALATYHVKQAVMRVDPRQVELYIRLAELYELRGMRDQALRYYQYARQVVPDTPQSAGRFRRLAERLGMSQ
jgi:tetratricopeptide (TPR) repeat protein